MADFTPLKSSNISAVAFDDDAQELLVEFKNGSLYAYPSAGKAAYEDMVTATSPGEYFARWIKSQPYRRVS